MTEIQESATQLYRADSTVAGGLDWALLALLDSTAGLIAVLAAGWIGIGLVTATVLEKRGHEFGPNAALGAVLGPLFVFLAYDTVRHRESAKPITISVSDRLTDPPVLVVAVGEADERATLEAIRSVGEIGSVTVAVPVEYEVGFRVRRMGGPPPEPGELRRLAEALSEYSPGLMLLPGPVQKSIPEAVRETGAELVLIVGDDSASVAPALSGLVTNVVTADA